MVADGAPQAHGADEGRNIQSPVRSMEVGATPMRPNAGHGGATPVWGVHPADSAGSSLTALQSESLVEASCNAAP